MDLDLEQNHNPWGKPAGDGPLGLNWAGVYPATIIPFTDRTCREVDEDAYRIFVRGILESDIAGIDPNEVEGLSRNETIRLMQIAKEESNGRVPVTGKVEPRNGEWTWDMVQEAEKVIEAGADVLYIHPSPEGENWEDFISLYKTFDRAFDIPIIGLLLKTPPSVVKEISLNCRNIAAWKYFCDQNIGLMKQIVWGMQEVEEQTGRRIAALTAGDHALAECLVNGADGVFNGGGSWRAEYDVAIYQAVSRGDLNEAFAIQKSVGPATEACRGVFGTDVRTTWRFPYRYKLMAWMLGKIPNPYARLPRTAFSDEEVAMIRQALIDSGLDVVRDPAECLDLGIAEF